MHREVGYAQVLPLLDSSAPEVRDAAADILVSTRLGKPEDFATLVAGHRRGLPVLPVINAIGTPEAEEYVFAERSKSRAPTDLAWAVLSTGPRGHEALAAIYRSPEPIAPELHRALCAILHAKPNPSLPPPPIAPTCLAVARDSTVPPHNRTAALEMLGLLGDKAAETVPSLREIAGSKSDPIAAAAGVAADRIEGKGTLARLLPDLEFELGPEYPTVWRSLEDTLRELSSLGYSGHAAGPQVVRLLDSHKWELRVEAARLLGAIGYTEATPQLLLALENSNDWLLSGAAAEALVRLGAHEAIPALQRLAAGHWYPPIRALAAESIRVLAGETRFPKPERPRKYIEWDRDMAVDCHVREFDEHRPETTVLRILGPRLACFAGSTWDRAWLWRAYRVAKASTSHSSRPDYGQAFGDGYLLGYDDGEWGGRIAYMVKGELVREFRVGNSKGFYPMPFGLVAVTSHFQSGESMLYLITSGAGGAVTCEPYKRIPFETESGFSFAPVARRWNRELLIVGNHQAMVLTRAGELRLAD
jgi:hypothetical protein